MAHSFTVAWLSSEEEDVQDSQATVSDCGFRRFEDEEVVNMASGDGQAADNHSAVDHDEAVDLEMRTALGLG